MYSLLFVIDCTVACFIEKTILTGPSRGALGAEHNQTENQSLCHKTQLVFF